MSDYTRRDFLKTASAATLSALAAGAPTSLLGSEPDAGKAARKIEATADRLVILYMSGGMTHVDTFDPKRYTPFEQGLETASIESTFPAIPTSVDGLQITAGLENVARVMDRAALIRSYKAADLGRILHTKHQGHWHTGYPPPQTTVAAPHIGAWIARTLGPLNPVVPTFFDIGQRVTVGEGDELKTFHNAGFLGSEFGPFMVPEPEKSLESVRPAQGMNLSRYSKRYELYRKLQEKSPVLRHGSEYQRDSLLRAAERTHRLVTSPEVKALDLSLEPKKNYEIYDTGRFGKSCLLARRLLEAGARFIELTTEYIPFKNWDSHENGHARIVDMKQQIDRPIAQLILDLEERGLLDRTLVVIASEFSRDAMVEGRPGKTVADQAGGQPDRISEARHYGHHRHFTDAGSVVLFGGGMKPGHVYGKTNDEHPFVTVDKPVVIDDLLATIYHALGIPSNHFYEIEQRPFYVTPDGRGKPIMELFA